MSVLKRFGYYLIGFSAGLIILAIFWNKKNAEFCYGIDCRVLKNIRSKNLAYTPQSDEVLKNNNIDSLTIQYILNKGDVDISRSNTKLDSCKIYVIDGDTKKGLITLTIENCNRTATVTLVDINKKAQ